jgi:myosin heavy subunit
MDNDNNSLPEYTRNKINQPKKRKPVLLIVIVVIMAGALGYLYYTYSELQKQSAVEKAELERQREQLENELLGIYDQYDSLKSENDTMNLKLLAEQERIEKLLKVNANSVYKIKMYENELQTIRKVLRSYIVQIDSLNQANMALRTENIEVKKQLRKTEKEKDELHEEKEELSEQVEKASILNAKNLVITPLNERSREKYKPNKIEKIRVCFTLRENAIVHPGTKTIYMRIARPDDVILTSGVNLFEYQGEQIVYSGKREVEYENIDVDMCIYWTNDGQLIPGSYNVTLFAEGNDIGSSTFALK